ncbi:hypothetical protein P3T76_008197 [Phytophthora citrophthora]|uniref:DUF6570 domain-containing protein n=1 Tax=Phytophthora citrophthora TaxID=4793 RepID=A0AAD9GK74_9STRA|nr:hypothetical protein P3T76_008197 [Phytophthora citrophthora]
MHMISLGDDRDRIQLMHFLLSSVDEQLPMELAVEYDCSELFACLGGMLLSKRGNHPAGYFQICQECNASLAKQLLPKFSIKNGFYVGSLPNRLTNTKLPERLMTQTLMISAVTRVVRARFVRINLPSTQCRVQLPRCYQRLPATSAAIVS